MKNIKYWLLLAGFAMFFLCGCSPAKQAARQNEALDKLKEQFDADKKANESKVIAEYLKSNPCIFPEINLDSLCSANYPPEGFITAKEFFFDTIRVKDTVWITKWRIPQEKKILVPTPDKRRENLLQDSVTALQKRLGECNAKAAGKQEAVSEIKPDKWRVSGNWWFWVALTLGVAWIAYAVIKIVK